MINNRRAPKPRPRVDEFEKPEGPKLREFDQIPKHIELKNEGQILQIFDPNFMRQKNESIMAVALMVSKNQINASKDEKKQLNRAYYKEKSHRNALAAQIGSIRQQSTPTAHSPSPIPTFTNSPMSTSSQINENDENEFYNEEVSPPSSYIINNEEQDEEEQPADVSPIMPDHFSSFAFEDLPHFQLGPPPPDNQIENVSIGPPDILDLVKEFTKMTI